MSEVSISRLKNSHLTRKNEADIIKKRKIELLILVQDFLIDQGYRDTANTLHKETFLAQEDYESCDNISLESVLIEFKSYYTIKFNKEPKIIRKKQLSGVKNLNRKTSASERKVCRSIKDTDATHIQDQREKTNGDAGLVIESKSILKTSEEINQERTFALRPLDSSFQGEMRDLAKTICNDIIIKNLNIGWDSVIGLREAKKFVKEAVVYPIKYPSLFSGILTPWKGLLLFGPPGTGKTLLAKAVATECGTTFFNISASTVVSKWRGESEKLIRNLFDLARYYAPSTIFIDELDSLMGHRSSAYSSTEHEGSRRLKTELLIQLDGLVNSKDLVFLLAASNIPWELDSAILRRLDKRIYVGLPEFEARKSMMQKLLPASSLENSMIKSDIDYEHVARLTEGYSGADLALICRESAMRKMRNIFDQLEGRDRGIESVKIDPITTKDVLKTLETTKRSGEYSVEKYVEFESKFGSS